jgi:tetratricopeptide (TPR) repeat protein
LDLLNIEVPSQLDGESLKNFLEWGEGNDRTVIAETDYPLHFGWAPLRAVRADGMKFIEAPRPELYDLSKDPNELHNGYDLSNEAVQKSRKVLADRWARMPAPVSGSVGIGAAESQDDSGTREAGSGSNISEPSKLPDPKDKIEEQNLLHSAMLAGEAGKIADARAALERVLERNPKSETALVQLGSLSLRSSDYQKAVEYLAQARQLRPDDATAAFYEGEAREKSGDLSGAKDALETCVRLNPKQSADARALLGQVYLRLQDYAAAEDQFEATLLLQPEHLEAHLGLARAEILQRRFSEALNELTRLAKAHPGSAEVFELLGQTYSGLGRESDAAKAKLRAKELASKAGK